MLLLHDVYWVSSHQDIREYLVQCTVAIYIYLYYNESWKQKCFFLYAMVPKVDQNIIYQKYHLQTTFSEKSDIIRQNADKEYLNFSQLKILRMSLYASAWESLVPGYFVCSTIARINIFCPKISSLFSFSEIEFWFNLNVEIRTKLKLH